MLFKQIPHHEEDETREDDSHVFVGIGIDCRTGSECFKDGTDENCSQQAIGNGNKQAEDNCGNQGCIRLFLLVFA